MFSDGDPQNNVKGTLLVAAWLNAVQEELAAVIELLGVTLDPEDNNQLSALLAAYSNRPGDFIFLPYEPTTGQMVARRILEGNGGSVLDSDYPEILTAWGGKIYGNVDSTHFNLPLLSGYFPRFWNHGAGIDPDATSRTSRGDGTTGDYVGTRQEGQIKSHLHMGNSYDTPGSVNPSGTGFYQGGTNIVTAAASSCPSFGGTETRPKNIYIWGGIFY